MLAVVKGKVFSVLNLFAVELDSVDKGEVVWDE